MPRRVKSPRAYDASGRREQARATRREVVEAATALFVERGYAATTMADVAARAGVAVQTVYSAVGGKAALVKAAVDVAIVGDDEPVAVPDRPEIAAVRAEVEGRRKLEMFAAYVSGVQERLGPLVAVLEVAADGDDEAARVLQGLQRGRLQGMTELATNLHEQQLLRPGLTVEQAAAVLTTHIDTANWRNLVLRHGFTREQFARWLVDVTEAALLRR